MRFLFLSVGVVAVVAVVAVVTSSIRVLGSAPDGPAVPRPVVVEPSVLSQVGTSTSRVPPSVADKLHDETPGEPRQHFPVSSVSVSYAERRLEACVALMDVQVGEVVDLLSPCFDRDYPEVARMLRSANEDRTLGDVLGHPAEIVWPEYGELTQAALAWFDQETGRGELGCPVAAAEARFAMHHDYAYHTGVLLDGEMNFPWWISDPGELHDIVWADYDWDAFDGDFAAATALAVRRSRWEDRALAGHPWAKAWVAVSREVCLDLDSPSLSWLYGTFDADPCVDNGAEPVYYYKKLIKGAIK